MIHQLTKEMASEFHFPFHKQVEISDGKFFNVYLGEYSALVECYREENSIHLLVTLDDLWLFL